MDEPRIRRARREYQRRVGSLLAAIDERNRRRLALAAHGVMPMGMLGLEQETRELRNELAAVIAAGSNTRPTTLCEALAA